MKSVRNIYHHFYRFFFLFVFLVLILFHPAFSRNTLSSTESLTISINRTLVSPGNDFELGYFQIGSTSLWYLGIWYKKVGERTYAWVANRDKPLRNSIGTLEFSGMKLVLLDQSNKTVWSTNLTRGNGRSPVVAELFANGNFVVRYSNNNDPSGFLWQSFDFPTDTLLPEMKLGLDRKTGRNRFLRSWNSSDSPSSGEHTCELYTRGFPEFFVRNSGIEIYRSGPWNGIRINGIPEERRLDYIVYNFTETIEEVAFTFQVTNHSIYARLTISDSLSLFTWTPPAWGWREIWSLPVEDECDFYQICGPYSFCDTSTSPRCNCFRGFDPWNKEQWETIDGSMGCVRRTNLSCSGDGFFRLKKMKLPDTTWTTVDRTIGLKECKAKCLKDCNCTAYASADIRNGGLGCVIWTGELVDIRTYVVGGQDIYVRLATADLGKEGNANRKIIALIIGVGVVLLLSSIIFCLWKRRHKRDKSNIATPIVYQERNQHLIMDGVIISSSIDLFEENLAESFELPVMEFKAVAMATDNFSQCNKLGQGGFGIVYKGRLLDGQEIAVKRLSEMSHQGTSEFKNELKLIAKLQHVNLVRILGCCFEAKEKMLIYEYLENLSLDTYLFDKSQSSKLNWKKRLDITNGIARGLLYLHQDSRCRIIHRDLKASNVLLDKDMIPKISDFGMARIFARDVEEAITRRIVGTYGYMAPEYAVDGIFSEKSDVFSFGVLVLEIVSGKRNRGSYIPNQENNLLSYVWRNWKEGNALEIVDPIIVDSSSSLSTCGPQDVLKCIQIGLLCVQEFAEDRPPMLTVVLMLGSETSTIPQPKPPAYCVGRSPFERDDECWTVNQITVSIIDGR